MVDNKKAREEESTSHNHGLTIRNIGLHEKPKHYTEVISGDQKYIGEIETFIAPKDVPFQTTIPLSKPFTSFEIFNSSQTKYGAPQSPYILRRGKEERKKIVNIGKDSGVDQNPLSKWKRQARE